MSTHHVGIGQIVTSSTAGDRIDMLGLGSCVGIFLHAPGYVSAAHCLLDAAKGRSTDTPGKFVDTAVPHLLALSEKAGVAGRRLTASIAGGAQIFAFSGGRPELEIGARNIEAATGLLRKRGIRIATNDTGGTTPRRAIMVVGEERLVVTHQAARAAAA
ncbi:MAG: chemotaxis protein CheD [Actinomycetota bacterium]